MSPPVVLAVAGTDSGGAAGLAADLATIGHLGAHAACVVTAVTAQDTLAVRSVHTVPYDDVVAQMDAVLSDLPVATVKTGMLGSPDVVRLVAERFREKQVVVDPVLVATSGAVLGAASVARAYVDHLLPYADVVTPNLDEARALLELDISAPEAAARLADHGCAALVTGGDEGGIDWLAEPGCRPVLLGHEQVATINDHGTGCTHSSALAAHLAHGVPLQEAAERAAAYVTGQLRHGQAWRLGRGRGPVAHTLAPWAEEEWTGHGSRATVVARS